MSAEAFVNLIEEMVDLKVHQRIESHLRTKPELARLLEDKRQADRQRLDRIKRDLVSLLDASGA